MITVLSLNRLGMCLIKMDDADEQLRFLDDIDMTLSMDSRVSNTEERTSVEVSSGPIVFKTSYRDLNLIMAIINRAFELSQTTTEKSDRSSNDVVSKPSASRRSIQRSDSRVLFQQEPQVFMSRQQVSTNTETPAILISNFCFSSKQTLRASDSY